MTSLFLNQVNLLSLCTIPFLHSCSVHAPLLSFTPDCSGCSVRVQQCLHSRLLRQQCQSTAMPSLQIAQAAVSEYSNAFTPDCSGRSVRVQQCLHSRLLRPQCQSTAIPKQSQTLTNVSHAWFVFSGNISAERGSSPCTCLEDFGEVVTCDQNLQESYLLLHYCMTYNSSSSDAILSSFIRFVSLFSLYTAT